MNISDKRFNRPADIAIIAGSIGSILAGVVLYAPHIVFNGSVSQVHALAGSPEGMLVSAFDSSVASSFSEANLLYPILLIALIAGLLAVVAGVVQRNSRPSSD